MEDDEDDDVDFNENDTSMSVMSDIMLVDSGVYIFHKMVLFKPTEYRLVYQMHFLQ